MLFSYKIVKPDAEVEHRVESDTRDVAVWERVNKFGRTLADLAPGRVAMADHYGVAWAAARRHGLEVGKLAEFEAAWTVEILKDEVEPDPTQPEAPTEG